MKCFKVVLRFEKTLGLEQRNARLESFTEQAIDANELQCGGGGHEDVWDVAVESGRDDVDDVTEAQRQAVIDWLEAEPKVLDYVVGDLYDDEPIDDEFVERLERVVDAMEQGESRQQVERLLDELTETDEDASAR